MQLLGAAGTPPGSASQRLSDLQQRHAQLLADVESAERSHQQATALSTRAEGEAAVMLQRLAAAGQQAQEREAAVAALAAQEAASKLRLEQLASSIKRQADFEKQALESIEVADDEADEAERQLEEVRWGVWVIQGHM